MSIDDATDTLQNSVNIEWARTQVEQAAETFRFLVGLTVAGWTIILGADAGLVVLGVTVKSQAVLLWAAGLPLVCAAVWLAMSRSLLVLAYIGLRAEETLGEGLVGTYGRVILPKRTARIKKFVDMPAGAAESRLRRIRIAPVGVSVAAGMVCLSIAQIVFALGTWN